MADKPDPLGPPDPSNPWYVPPDFPVFTDPPPAPVDPTFAPGRTGCPHCGVQFRSTNHLQRTGEYGVCHACRNTLVYDAGRWRMVTYDEAVEAEADPRHMLLQRNFTDPLPGS